MKQWAVGGLVRPGADGLPGGRGWMMEGTSARGSARVRSWCLPEIALPTSRLEAVDRSSQHSLGGESPLIVRTLGTG
jgi:hypothetical protein